jgi:hypothetical protein
MIPPRSSRSGLLSRTCLLVGAVLSGSACGSVQVDHPGDDYVPPVLLSPPEAPDPTPLATDLRMVTNSARQLRAELRRFADTAASHARSYPAARCCPQELRDLMVRGHRWDAAAEGEEHRVMPILERLVKEPELQHAPRLLDLVIHRVTAAGLPPS